MTCGLSAEQVLRGKPVYDIMRTELMAGQYLDLLEQAMGGLGEVDWRPMIGSLLLGSLEDAGLEPA